MCADTCSSETERNVRSRVESRVGTRNLELLDNYGGRELIVGRAMTRGVDTLPRFHRTKASNRMKFDTTDWETKVFPIKHDQNL